MNRNIETCLMGWLPCPPFLGWEEEKVWAETAINLYLSSWESWPWLWESALENVCRPCTLSSGVMAASIHGGDDILRGVILYHLSPGKKSGLPITLRWAAEDEGPQSRWPYRSHRPCLTFPETFFHSLCQTGSGFHWFIWSSRHSSFLKCLGELINLQ